MQNLDIKRNGNKLTIEIDLSKKIGPSKTGKTVLIATTNGNASVPGPGDMKIGLNLYEKANA